MSESEEAVNGAAEISEAPSPATTAVDNELNNNSKGVTEDERKGDNGAPEAVGLVDPDGSDIKQQQAEYETTTSSQNQDPNDGSEMEVQTLPVVNSNSEEAESQPANGDIEVSPEEEMAKLKLTEKKDLKEKSPSSTDVKEQSSEAADSSSVFLNDKAQTQNKEPEEPVDISTADGITSKTKAKFERKISGGKQRQKSLDKDDTVKTAGSRSPERKDRKVSAGRARVSSDTSKHDQTKARSGSTGKVHSSTRKASDADRKASGGSERKPSASDRRISVGRERGPSVGEERKHSGPTRKQSSGVERKASGDVGRKVSTPGERKSSTSAEKRSSFSSKGRAATVASTSDSKRSDFAQNRTSSLSSDPKKARSTSATTRTTTTRKTSSTTDRARAPSNPEEEPKLTPSQIRARFEAKTGSKTPTPRKPVDRTGNTAASRARFERPASAPRKTSSTSPRKSSTLKDETDGSEVHSASSIRAKFESQRKTSASDGRKKLTTTTGKPRAMSANKKPSGPSANSCLVCGKTVYPMEKREVDGKLYHKFCFKCETCKTTLSLGNYASLEGKNYCKPHLKQLFRLKGNYDEGFGREQHKTQWSKKQSNGAQSSNPAAANTANKETTAEGAQDSPDGGVDSSLQHNTEDISNEVSVEA